MPQKKVNETEILADIVRALRDKNTTVQVQTVNAQDYDDTIFIDGADHIPMRDGKIRRGLMSDNRAQATGIKINDNIQIQKKQGSFIIHTPHGEMNVPVSYQDDMFALWTAALGVYDSQNNGDQDTFSRAQRTMKNNLKNPELREIADSPVKQLDTRSKYEKAMEKMKALGVTKTKNMDAFIMQKMQHEQDI